MKLPPVAAKLLKSRAGGAGGGASRLSKLPRSTWYALATLLLALGLASGVMDLLARAGKERAYADHEKQRLTFVGEQGEAGGKVAPKTGDHTDFDVDMSPEERKLNASKKTPEPKESEPEKETPVTDDTKAVNEEPAKEEVPAPVEEKETPKVEEPKEEPTAAIEPVKEEATQEAVAEQVEEQAAAAEPVAPATVDGLVALSDAPPPAVPAIKPSEKSLVFAPAREVTKQTKAGALPVTGAKGARPFEVYQRAYRPQDGKSMLGIVVTGMGFSAQSLNLALAMPPEISLSFSPYGNDVTTSIDSVRNGGHEVWFDLPTQSVDYPTRDPGPLGIISTLPAKDREQRLRQSLIATRGAVGAIFPLDDALKNNSTVMHATVKTLNDHGVEAFYSGEGAPKGMRHPHVVMLSSASPTRLASELSALTKRLNDTTPMIVLAQGSPHVLQAISRWVATDVKAAPVSLAPLSAFYMDYAAIAAEEEAAAANAGKEEKKGGH